MSARRALAGVSFALTVVGSYALQRLVDSVDEPPMAEVLRSASIPYFWRVSFATVHGLGAACAAWFGLSETRAEQWLAAAPRWVWVVVLPAALAMAWVP